MNTLDFDNEDDLESAFTDAVHSYSPPAGLKESIRERLFGQAARPLASQRPLRTVGSKSRKLLAVAVATALLLAAAVWLGWPETELVGVAYAEFAEVIENTNRAEWVHFFEKDGREFWLSFQPYRFYSRTASGDIYALDRPANRLYDYDADKNTLAVSFAPNPGGWSAEFFGNFTDYMQMRIGKHEEAGKEVRKGTTTLDGKAVDVYVVAVSHQDQQGELKYYADPQSDRIVCVEVAGTGMLAWYKWRTRIDYPTHGPENVHALGVPQDAKIVDRTPPQQVLELVERVEEAAGARHVSFYQVSVEVYELFSAEYAPWAGATVEVTNSQGRQRRVDRYSFPCPSPMSGQEAAQYLERLEREVPVGRLEDVEAWLASRKPYKIIITDNARGEDVVFHVNEDGTLITDVLHFPVGLLAWGVELDGRPTLLEDEGPWGKLVGIENHDSPLKLHRWYFNPDREYVCEKTERQVNGSVSKRTEVIEYDKTPSGQWFRKKLRRTEYGGRDKIIITNFKDDRRTIPPKVFDGSRITAADLSPS